MHLGERLAEGIKVPEVDVLDVAAPCAPETYTLFTQNRTRCSRPVHGF